MSTLAERERHAEAPGYWAIEVRLDRAGLLGKRYLCKADNDRAAFVLARRLVGADDAIRGFNSFWIDEPEMPGDYGALLRPGTYLTVNNAGDWNHLMVAHDASQAIRDKNSLS